MRPPLLAVLALALLSLPVSASEHPVGISLRAGCRRPLPQEKTWTPCAAAHALNMIAETEFLLESREAERSYWAQPQPSTAALACVDDNAIEYMYEREDLLADLKRIRTWAEAAKDIAAEVEDPGCIESAGGYMVGGDKSDHPKKMAMNVGASAWMLIRYHGKARERQAKNEQTEEDKAAASKEAKEFDWQRGFLLSQLAGLEAWTEKAVSPGAVVEVKDEAPKPVDFEKLGKELAELKESLEKSKKASSGFWKESAESKKKHERFLKMLEKLKRPLEAVRPGPTLKPLPPKKPE